MRSILRALIVPAVGIGIALPMAGCGNPNENSMAGTKGTAAPNAPKTQAEFYNQQKSVAPPAKTKAP
jgi:hypothetical protein